MLKLLKDLGIIQTIHSIKLYRKGNEYPELTRTPEGMESANDIVLSIHFPKGSQNMCLDIVLSEQQKADLIQSAQELQPCTMQISDFVNADAEHKS